MSLEFKPLYWIYHDGWKYKEEKVYSVPDGRGGSVPVRKDKEFNHAGHIHFFMLDMPLDQQSTSAYTGEQVYNFKITDTWGPNSTDPNQSKNIKLIGKPLWYFYIEEYWRRIYIQPWEDVESNFTLLDNINYAWDNGQRAYFYINAAGQKVYFSDSDIRIIDNQKYIDISTDDIGKKGIKYDASKPEHSFGPFREGGQFHFFNTVVNRTMPIEYWKEKSKHTRDYFIKSGEESETSGGQTWTFACKDQIFQWIYDTHFINDTWSDYYTSFSIGRGRDLYSATRNNHYKYFYGTNAKRLKQDLDNALLNKLKDEEKDEEWNGWQARGWTGWFEYSGNTIISDKTKNPRENILYCDPNQSHSWGTMGRYYTEKDPEKKNKYKANYYKRIYKPTGYEINNQSLWTVNLRQHFPAPPPYLNPDYPEDLVQLYWEYLYYFDKVCYYQKSGNKETMNYEEGRWETYLIQYAIDKKGMKKGDTNFEKYLNLEDYTACFNAFLSEYNDYFFQYEITAQPGTPDFTTQLKRKNDGRNPQTNDYVHTSTGGTVSNACEMYLNFEEFSREIWNPLNEDEIKCLKLNGDYPSLKEGVEIPKSPLPSEEEASSSSLSSFTEFDKLSKENAFDFTKQGTVSPKDVWLKYFDKMEIYTIPEDTVVKGGFDYETSKEEWQFAHPREASFSIEDGARWNYPDDKYVYPVIEYQKIIHSNYQRLHAKRGEEFVYGFDDRNYGKWRKDKTGDWGDGFEVTVTIPYKVNNEIQSPFSGKDKITQPAGVYFHDVIPEEYKMRYHVEWFDSLLQIRKYDLPTYVTLINEFKELYPDYSETFAEGLDDIQKYHDSERVWKDENGNEQKKPWKEFIEPFWNSKKHLYENTPVTKRDDEGKIDEITGIYRDKVTQNCVTIDKVSTITLEDGSKAYGYRDSKGNIIKGGNVVQFNNPYEEHTDGRWVEQCLGAIVKPKVLLVLEDPVGYRWIEEVTSTALTSNNPIVGNGL